MQTIFVEKIEIHVLCFGGGGGWGEYLQSLSQGVRSKRIYED